MYYELRKCYAYMQFLSSAVTFNEGNVLTQTAQELIYVIMCYSESNAT